MRHVYQVVINHVQNYLLDELFRDNRFSAHIVQQAVNHFSTESIDANTMDKKQLKHAVITIIRNHAKNILDYNDELPNASEEDFEESQQALLQSWNKFLQLCIKVWMNVHQPLGLGFVDAQRKTVSKVALVA